MLMKLKQKKNKNYLRQKINYNIYVVAIPLNTRFIRVTIDKKKPALYDIIGHSCDVFWP